MSRHIYRLCYTQTQVNRAGLKISNLILGWFRQFFAKSTPVLVCIKPQNIQANETNFKLTLIKGITEKTINSVTPSPDEKAHLHEHSELRFNSSSNPLTTMHQEPADPTQGPRQTLEQALTLAQDKDTLQVDQTLDVNPLVKPTKKSNLLFLKVYNGPIFQDKKVLAYPNKSDQQTPSNQAVASSSVVRQFSPKPNHKNGVFISGKMSDIFAQLDALAA